VGLKKAANKFGRTMEVAVHLKGWVKEADFEEAVEERTVVPNNPWAKDGR
jgi:ribosomal protein L1